MTFASLLGWGLSIIGAGCVLSLLVLAFLVWSSTRPQRIPSDRAARRIALVQAQTSEELAIRRAAHILSTY